MPIRLTAIKPHRYGGRLIRKGERYEADSERDADILTLVGYSSREPDPPVPALPEPALTLETRLEPPAADPIPRKRRHYRRKDMVAED